VIPGWRPPLRTLVARILATSRSVKAFQRLMLKSLHAKKVAPAQVVRVVHVEYVLRVV
jgi:hypothetical protein